MTVTDGSTSRLERAYDAYADMLYRLALSQLNHSEDAEDAVQDVFARYVTHAPDFTDSEHERAWLVRVTVNRCHDLARRRSIRTHEELDEQHDIPVQQESSGSAVLDTLADIPEKYRTSIVLHHLEGFSVEEVAAMLRVSVSAVKMRLSRGREMMKALLQKEDHNV